MSPREFIEAFSSVVVSKNMRSRYSYRYVALAIVAIVLCLFAVIILNSNTGIFAERQASANVVAFGDQLKNVSLLAPDASSTMRTAYEPYVTEELLTKWQKDPEHAPGRLTSSPWPDHITVRNVARQGSGYAVSGEIALQTSTGDAGVQPFVALVTHDEGAWKIAAFEVQQTKTIAQ